MHHFSEPKPCPDSDSTAGGSTRANYTKRSCRPAPQHNSWWTSTELRFSKGLQVVHPKLVSPD